MNKKILTIIFGMIFMFSLVSADRILTNIIGIEMPLNVFAGNEFEASFSFDYPFGADNKDNSPLIIKLNIISEDDEYPIWKGDFEISGRVKKTFFGFPISTIEFNCSEEEEQTIEHPLDAQTVNAPNGVFYCYNSKGDLKLNENNKVFLDITSNQALYPGQYNFTAQMFYLTDGRAPLVNITNKEMFQKYYRELDNVLVTATIEDGSEIDEKWSTVMINNEEIFPIPYDHFEDGEYYFSRNTPSDIKEDDYELFVFANDIFGNKGNDSVTLKIDRTGPEITLVGLNDNDTLSGKITIIANVSDKKAGVDENEIYYRLREMNNSNICPESGMGSWDCKNTGWQNLVFNSNSGYFEVEIDTEEMNFNGEYWLEIEAFDILGNKGVLDEVN